MSDLMFYNIISFYSNDYATLDVWQENETVLPVRGYK